MIKVIIDGKQVEVTPWECGVKKMEDNGSIEARLYNTLV